MRLLPRTPAGRAAWATRAAWAIAAFALLLRAAAAWRWRGEVADDVDLYRVLAAGLLAGEGFADPATGVPTAFRPPLVPLMYAGLGNAGPAIGAFQALAGAATAGLTVRLASRLGLGWKLAAGAGLIVACDPVLLRYVARPMTETVCALLAAGLLCRLCNDLVWSRDRQGASLSTRARTETLPDGRGSICGAFVTGLLFGLCCLARPTFWAFGGLLAAGWLWDRLRDRAGWLVGWKTAAAAAVGVACAVGPWTGRNAAVFGKPIAMTTHGGYTLHLANNATFYRTVVRGPAGAVWAADGLDGLTGWQQFHEHKLRRELGMERFSMNLDDDAQSLPRPGWHGFIRNLPPGELRDRITRRRRRDLPHLWLWYEGYGETGYARIWLSAADRLHPAAELARDRWHRDAAVEFIRSDPAGFARAVPLRVSRFWGLAPLGEAAAGLPGAVRWAVGGWNAAAFLLAACGAWRIWRSDTRLACPPGGGEERRTDDTRDGRRYGWRAVLLLPVAFTVVHAVYWSNARMRAPVVPAVAVLAAAGAAGLLRGRRIPRGLEPAETPAK